MKPSNIQMMGPNFAAQLPTHLLRQLIMDDLLRRVLVEVPAISNTKLGSDILRVITSPNAHLIEGARS